MLALHTALRLSLFNAFNFSAPYLLVIYASIFGYDDGKWELLEAENMTCTNEWSITCMIKTIAYHTAHVTLGYQDQLKHFCRSMLD